MQTIVVRRVPYISLFKLLFVGFSVLFVPLIFIGAISAYFGLSTWTFNNEQLHGISILLNAAFCMVLFPVGFAAIVGGIACVGQIVFSQFRQMNITVIVD